MLVEHDQVIEHAHDRRFGVCKLLEHGQARDALRVIYPQCAARLLGRRRAAGRDSDQKRNNGDGDNTQLELHWTATLYLSNQMSSRRLPLEMLLTMIVSPLT